MFCQKDTFQFELLLKSVHFQSFLILMRKAISFEEGNFLIFFFSEQKLPLLQLCLFSASTTANAEFFTQFCFPWLHAPQFALSCLEKLWLLFSRTSEFVTRTLLPYLTVVFEFLIVVERIKSFRWSEVVYCVQRSIYDCEEFSDLHIYSPLPVIVGKKGQII